MVGECKEYGVSVVVSKKGDVVVRIPDALASDAKFLSIRHPEGSTSGVAEVVQVEAAGLEKSVKLNPLNLISMVSVSDELELVFTGSDFHLAEKVVIDAERLAVCAYRRIGVDSKPKGEAGRYARRRELERLEVLGSDENVSKYPGVLEVLGRAALARHDYNLAKAHWKRLWRIAPSFRDQCLLGLAEAERLIGNVNESAALLEDLAFASVGGATKTRKRLSEDRRLIEAEKAWADSREAALASRRSHFSRKAWKAVHLLNLSGEQTKSLAPLLEALGEFVEAFGLKTDSAHSTECYAHRLEPGRRYPKSVFCAGFGWSGSGAVFDFLRQYEEHFCAVKQEINLISNPYLTPSKVMKMDCSNVSLVKETIFRYIELAVLGFGEPIGKPTRIKKARSRSLQGLAAAGVMDVSSVADNTGDFVRSLTSEYPESLQASSAVINALKRYIRLVLASLSESNGGKNLVFSNAIHAYNLDLMDLLGPEAVAVPVLRDPRDQYVDRVMVGKGIPINRFVLSMALRYRRYNHFIKTSPSSTSVIPIRFEEFVLDREVRQGLLSCMGVNFADDDKRAIFDAGASSRNIEIYKEYSNQRDIRKIEASLGQYTYPRVGGLGRYAPFAGLVRVAEHLPRGLTRSFFGV